MKTGREEGEYDRLKAELRRLKRAGAPWYFESELHRRLHGVHHRRTRLLPFPIAPAFGFSLVTLAVIGIAAYLAFLTIQGRQHSVADSTGVSAPVAIPSDSSLLLTPAVIPDASTVSPRPRPQRVELPPRNATRGRSATDSTQSTVAPVPQITQSVETDQSKSARDTSGLPGARAVPVKDSVRVMKDTSAQPPLPRP